MLSNFIWYLLSSLISSFTVSRGNILGEANEPPVDTGKFLNKFVSSFLLDFLLIGIVVVLTFGVSYPFYYVFLIWCLYFDSILFMFEV